MSSHGHVTFQHQRNTMRVIQTAYSTVNSFGAGTDTASWQHPSQTSIRGPDGQRWGAVPKLGTRSAASEPRHRDSTAALAASVQRRRLAAPPTANGGIRYGAHISLVRSRGVLQEVNWPLCGGPGLPSSVDGYRKFHSSQAGEVNIELIPRRVNQMRTRPSRLEVEANYATSRMRRPETRRQDKPGLSHYFKRPLALCGGAGLPSSVDGNRSVSAKVSEHCPCRVPTKRATCLKAGALNSRFSRMWTDEDATVATRTVATQGGGNLCDVSDAPSRPPETRRQDKPGLEIFWWRRQRKAFMLFSGIRIQSASRSAKLRPYRTNYVPVQMRIWQCPYEPIDADADGCGDGGGGVGGVAAYIFEGLLKKIYWGVDGGQYRCGALQGGRFTWIFIRQQSHDTETTPQGDGRNTDEMGVKAVAAPPRKQANEGTKRRVAVVSAVVEWRAWIGKFYAEARVSRAAGDSSAGDLEAHSMGL
ncbi:hypothetical protein C8J57DRAFT_1218246 [Mycena rebaudengoi]|nr:hypothetical protein C8J57DRAFT_1218246 [Mycena rebaudengoi]